MFSKLRLATIAKPELRYYGANKIKSTHPKGSGDTPGMTRAPLLWICCRSLAALGAMAGAAILTHAQSPARPIPITPPPMGWSSWNSFSNTVNSQIVMDQAKALATSGLQKAGYEYVNID